MVLYYHSVPSCYRQRFENQMEIVASRAKTVDLRSINRLPVDTHSIAITFDDALESFSENALPVLSRLRIPVTVFAVADALGRRPWWGDSYYLPDERVMSAHQLQSLPDLVTVGAHTLTHVDVVSLGSDAASEEISGSREKLEALLRRSVTLFSFPFGIFNASTVRQCQEAGYERVFTTEPALTLANKDQYVIGRVKADPWDWRLEFLLKISGAYRWRAAMRSIVNCIRPLFLAGKPGSNELAMKRSPSHEPSNEPWRG